MLNIPVGPFHQTWYSNSVVVFSKACFSYRTKKKKHLGKSGYIGKFTLLKIKNKVQLKKIELLKSLAKTYLWKGYGQKLVSKQNKCITSLLLAWSASACVV